MPSTRSYMVDLTECNELILPFSNLPLIEDKMSCGYEVVGYVALRTTVFPELIKIDAMLRNNDRDSLETREVSITDYSVGKQGERVRLERARGKLD
jgi:hypothetical protein